MGITSSSQILNINEVETALEYLDDAKTSLETAFSELEAAEKGSGIKTLEVQGTNTLLPRISGLKEEILKYKNQITNLKNDSIAAANTVIANEREQLRRYEAEVQRQKEEAERREREAAEAQKIEEV